MKRCKKCGTMLRDDASFCSQCGSNQFASDEPEEKMDSRTDYNSSPKEKKKLTFGRVLLWIFFLPIMAIIAIWNSDRLEVKWKWILTAVVVVLCVGVSLSNRGGHKETIDPDPWPSYGLATLLPKPESDILELVTNSDDNLYVYIYDTSAEQYDNYVNKCIEKGFTIDASLLSGYSAYNEDGYYLELDYSKSSKEMTIDLNAPREMDEISWPTDGAGALLPAPESTLGVVEENRDDYFRAYIGNISTDAFNAYVDKCIAAGFNVDGDRDDDSFYSKNGDGCALSISYEGFNTIRIILEVPEEVEPVEEDDDDDNRTGIDPDFKAAMESYEKFFDEYIEFMNSYDVSDASMLVKYASMLAQYEDTMNKLDSIDEDDLTPEEDALYLETMTRINQKLNNALINMG